jgi:hypothetical protein
MRRQPPRKAAEKAQATWQKYKTKGGLRIDKVADVAHQIMQVNDEQTANLKTSAKEISHMQAGLFKVQDGLGLLYEGLGMMRDKLFGVQIELFDQSCEVGRSLEEGYKQRKHLTDLQVYLDIPGAKEEAATKQLQRSARNRR